MDNFYYKGFDKNLKCRGLQFSVGEKTKDPKLEDKNLSLCSRGIHFCATLKDVFIYYNNKSENRFCLVKPVGEFLKGSDKFACKEIEVIKELSKEDIDEIIKKEEEERKLKEMGIDVLQELQSKYNLFFAGSSALFLYGLDLDRKAGDIDVIMPYYQKITGDKDSLIDEAEEFDAKSSGNDFSYTTCITTQDGRFFKVDIRINPEQSYDVVSFINKSFKLSKLCDIIEAKARYWKEGNQKHGDDLKKLMGLPDKSKENNTVNTQSLYLQ